MNQLEEMMAARIGLPVKRLAKERKSLLEGQDWGLRDGKVYYTDIGQRLLLERLGLADVAQTDTTIPVEETVKKLVSNSEVVEMCVTKIFTPNFHLIEATHKGIKHIVKVHDSAMYAKGMMFQARHCLNMWFEVRRPRRKGRW